MAILIALAGAAMVQPPPRPTTVMEHPALERVYSAREAVFAAAETAPVPLMGTFALRVSRTGREGDRIYLNSEFDYRDQRNLTINIDPAVVRELTRRFGAPPETFLRGKIIVVTGLARRTQIDFIGDNGRRTGLYYYQTQVSVSQASQIALMERPLTRAH